MRSGWLVPERRLDAPLRDALDACAAWVRPDPPGRRVVDSTRVDRALAAAVDACVGAETPRGLLVHGDAADALRWLDTSDAPRPHVVYADPPYNTGLDTLPYPDARPRAEWLATIPPRLSAAWRRLAPAGALFCSIDDTELFHLKLALDAEVGEDAFLCCMPWIKRYSPPPDVGAIAYVHESVLAYRRSAAFRPGRLPTSQHQVTRYRNPDGDPAGPWKAADYTCRYTRFERPNLWYGIRNPTTGVEVWPSETRVWAYSPEAHADNVAAGRVWWGNTGRNKMPAYKKYRAEVADGMPPSSVLPHEVAGHTDGAARELRAVIPDVKFTPKPTQLVRHLCRVAGLPVGAHVLDPFAGSGSTGAAMLQWERETGEARPFVLVEEADTFDSVLVPRIARLTVAGTWDRGRPRSDDPLALVHRVLRVSP